VSEKEQLQKAADEARKVARAAREFGGFLDDYAKYLTQPTWRERADELHFLALNKLSAINAGLMACNKWVAESGKSAGAQPPEKVTKSVVASENEDLVEQRKPRAVRVKKGGSSI
jgi:hypothetical protein